MSTSRFTNGLTTAKSTDPMGEFILPDVTKAHVYFNDFDTYLAADWVVTEVGVATQALTNADGGVLLVTNAAADNNSSFSQKVGESFLMATGKKAWFEARFQVSDATQSDFIVGMQITDTTPLAVTDGIFFRKDDGDTDIDIVVTKDSVITTAVAATIVAATNIRLSFYYNGSDEIVYFVDGAYKGKLATTNLPDDEELTISFGIQNGEAVAKTMSVDYILAAKERQGNAMANPTNARIDGENVSQLTNLNVRNKLYVQGVGVDGFVSEVVVRSASDLSGTLDSTKVYLIDGVIDFTGTGISIEVPVGGLNLIGWTFDVSKLICSDVGYTMFTSPGGGSGNVLGTASALADHGATSQVYNITDTDGTNAFEFSRVNYNNCTSLGTITGYRQGLETGTGRFGGTPELTLAGTWAGGFFIETSIVRGLTDGSYSLFKAGAAFSMSSRFRTNQNVDLNATVSLLDFAPANFVNASTVQITDALVSRNGVFNSNDATVVPNMVASDLVASWTGNTGVSNTFVGGELNVTVEATTTITVAGTFVDLAGTWAVSDLQHFDEPANGQLRHLGQSPVEFKVSGQLVLDSTANNEVDAKVVIWRNATTSFEDGKTIRRVINNLQGGGRDVGYFAISDNITLSQNDYVKIQVANVATTNNVTAEIDSFFNVEER